MRKGVGNIASRGPNELGYPPTGLDGDEVRRLADRVETVTEQEVAGAFANIPLDWPVADAELENLIDFLLDRRDGVALRLRAIIGA